MSYYHVRIARIREGEWVSMITPRPTPAPSPHQIHQTITAPTRAMAVASAMCAISTHREESQE